MSHSVTIRTQTVTSSSSTIVVNTGYLKTWSGILKLLQVHIIYGRYSGTFAILREYFISYYQQYFRFPLQSNILAAIIVSATDIFTYIVLALGIVCVGIVGNEFGPRPHVTAELFFLLITTTFMIGTFILLLSCVTSLSTASILSKTIHELIYHSIAFGLLLAASLTLLVHINNYRRYNYELLLGASICGLVNAGLYLFSTIIALRTYRGV